MTPDQILLTVLSSSLCTGLTSAACTGFFLMRGKQTEYANDYYKTVVIRRLQAYEDVEKLIVHFKMAVVDTDMKPYHSVFVSSNEEDPSGLYNLLSKVRNQSMWLSDQMFSLTRDLSVFLFEQQTFAGKD